MAYPAAVAKYWRYRYSSPRDHGWPTSPSPRSRRVETLVISIQSMQYESVSAGTQWRHGPGRRRRDLANGPRADENPHINGFEEMRRERRDPSSRPMQAGCLRDQLLPHTVAYPAAVAKYWRRDHHFLFPARMSASGLAYSRTEESFLANFPRAHARMSLRMRSTSPSL